MEEKKYDPETKFCDHSHFVLSHPKIAPLYQELIDITPVLTRNDWLNAQVGWRYGLRNHPNYTYVQELLHKNTHGWKITSQVIDCDGATENYECTIEEIEAALNKILKLLKAGRFLGPFKTLADAEKYFNDDDLKIWPIFFKKEGYKHRMLIDLSHNKNIGRSLNNCVTQEERTVHYIMIKQICQWIIDADLKILWSIDAFMAYYSVPIEPQFTPKMGIKLCGLYFFFITLSMGLASACKLYMEFASALNWIVVNNCPLFSIETPYGDSIPLLKNYMDDFLGGATSIDMNGLTCNAKQVANEQLKQILYWWNLLGVPTQERKIILPHEWIEYIGFIFDCALRQLRIPIKRLDKYTDSLWKLIVDMKEALDCPADKSLNLKRVQSVVGECRSIQMVYINTIPFLRSTENLINIPGELINGKWKYKTNWIKPTLEAYNDLSYVHNIYKTPKANQMPFAWLLCKQSDCDITIYTDAATTEGVGGFIDIKQGDWFCNKWSDFDILTHYKHSPDITFLELAGMVIACDLFAEQLTNKRVLFRCDNEAACFISIKKSACLNRPDLTALMMRFCDIAYRYNIRIYPKHIAGVKNKTADDLSRLYKLIGNHDLPDNKSIADTQITNCLTAWGQQEKFLNQLVPMDEETDGKFAKKFPSCDCKTVDQLAVCEKIRLSHDYLL